MSNRPELELKHILPYLPHGLKAISPENVISVVDVYMQSYDGERVGLNFLFSEYKNTLYKPLLRPMSDLFENIVHNGTSVCVGDDILQDMNKLIVGGEAYRESYFQKTPFHYLEYWVINRLFEYHFDVFGLIEKGLAEPIKNK
jgi:hypothetical protein